MFFHNSVLINKAEQVTPSFTNYKLRGLTSIKEKHVNRKVLLENCLGNKKERSKLEKRHSNNNNTKQ